MDNEYNPWYYMLNCNKFNKNSSNTDEIQLFGFIHLPSWAKIVLTVLSDAVGAAAGVAAGAGTPASIPLGIECGATASATTAAVVWIRAPGE